MARIPSHLYLRLIATRRLREGAYGFSTAAVVIILLLTVVGLFSLLNRATSGRVGAAFSSDTQAAREVARSAAVRIIGELTTSANRGMLVSGVPLNAWATSPAGDLENPCRQPPVSGTAVPPTAAARSFGSSTPQNLVAGDATRRFVVRSIRYSSADRNHWIQSAYDASGTHALTTSSGNDFLVNRSDLYSASDSLLELSVEGLVYNADGTLASRATVTQEFVVVPKCCNRSFNGTANAYGNGSDDVKGTDATQCAGGGASGSIITETSGDASGQLDTQNMHLYTALPSGTNSLLTEFECLTTAARCVGADAGANPGIAEAANGDVPASIIPSLPPPPAFPGVVWPHELNTGADLYFRINATNTGIERCEVTGTSTLQNCTPASYCIKLSNAIADYHCRMSRIRISAANIFFDTTGGPIAFYLHDSPGEYKTSGSSVIAHRRCSSFPGATTMCATAAQPGDFGRLAFYSNLAGANFEFTGTSVNIVAFMYNQRGRVHQSGGSSIYGAVWANVLSGSGNSNVYVPTNIPSMSTSKGYCSLMASNCSVSPFDWVARSLSRQKVF